MRYSGIKETEIELRYHFCIILKKSSIPIQQNAVIDNLYKGQLKKIQAILQSLHEDLQHDFDKKMQQLY